MRLEQPPQKSSAGRSSGVNINAQGDVIIAGDVAGGDIIKSFVTQVFGGPAAAQYRRNLLALLAKVRRDWIEGVLEKSLHSIPPVELGKELAPELVERRAPWTTLLEIPERPGEQIPAGAPLIEVFDKVEHALLILGAPGSGKTFTLLELARAALARAEQDLLQPVPVVLNLSSWSERHPALTAWLLEELFIRYQVPKRLGQEWIEHDSLLLLLDGLDEVAEGQRARCLAAINAFRDQHGLAQIAVCSRTEDYRALRTQLKMGGALLIQALTDEQIDAYLGAAGLSDLRAEVRQDVGLGELLRSPLMLSIAGLAHQDLRHAARRSLTELQPAARRAVMFEAYVQAMFRRVGRVRNERYSAPQTIAWLAWLAGQMLRSHQAIFVYEEIQPDWLPRPWKTLIEKINAVALKLTAVFDRMLASPSSGPVIGIVLRWYALSLALSLPVAVIAPPPGADYFGAVVVIGSGVFAASAMVLLLLRLANAWFRHFWTARLEIVETLTWTLRTLTDRWRFWLGLGADKKAGLVKGYLILYGFLLTLWIILIYMFTLLSPFVLPAAIVTVIMILGFSGLRIGQRQMRRRPAEGIWQSGQNALAVLGIAVLVTCLVVVAFGWIFAQDKAQQDADRLRRSFLYSSEQELDLLIDEIAGSDFARAQSLTREQVSQRIRAGFMELQESRGLASPETREANIQTVYRNTLWQTFIESTLRVAAPIAILVGLVAGWHVGGSTFVRHFALRLVLAAYRCIPWNYTRFLDYAAERVFLRKVGSGYIFIHRYLLEYFAALNDGRMSR